jgi:hypothetical protein
MRAQGVQMSEQTDRDVALREIAKKRVVYALPGMDALPVRRDLNFRSTSGASLLMDVYYPPLSAERPLPLVLLATAYSDPAARVRVYGPLTSWARLMAASGMAAVIYGTDTPAADVHAVLRHLRDAAGSLGLDGDRFGLFAASGNVPVGLATLIRDRRLRCGALLYGHTMDMDGSTTVAEAARHFGFVDACAGMSVDDLPCDIPLLFVRAGGDQLAGLNASLDRVIARALARNLPLSLINHAAGAHGFDLDEHTAASRAVVQQVLTFLHSHLST